jgi:ABC-2 type transport system ATP-binding protein
MIVMANVSRWYGQVIGVNDVTHQIGPGVTALLGMNGAGKSTLMRLITGQIRPTTGTLTVFGQEPFANPEVFRRVGYCPEIDNFYEYMTGREFVYTMARMNGMTDATAKRHASEMLERVNMAHALDRKIAGYSKGMRQRVKLAQAMVHDPEVILLDEPLNGLDPVGRREFMGYLGEFSAQGKTIIVSSHILFEVEQMTRSIMLLNRGRLLAAGDVRTIREYLDRYPHRIRIETPQPRELASRLIALPYVLKVDLDEWSQAIELQTRELNQFYEVLPQLVLNENIPIRGVTSPDNNLESIFKYLVEA